MGMLAQEEIKKIGFKSLGDNVTISDKAQFYGAENISLGDNVRIDDFCILSSGKEIKIGNYVHIACHSSIIGKGAVTISDFAGLSSRVSIYSSSDDYSGEYLTNPTVPSKFSNVNNDDVFLGKHVIIGCGSVILPGTHIANGVAIGALSLVNKNCEEFYIYAGNPAKRIKPRKRNLIDLEKELLNSIK